MCSYQKPHSASSVESSTGVSVPFTESSQQRLRRVLSTVDQQFDGWSDISHALGAAVSLGEYRAFVERLLAGKPETFRENPAPLHFSYHKPHRNGTESGSMWSEAVTNYGFGKLYLNW